MLGELQMLLTIYMEMRDMYNDIDRVGNNEECPVEIVLPSLWSRQTMEPPLDGPNSADGE